MWDVIGAQRVGVWWISEGTKGGRGEKESSCGDGAREQRNRDFVEFGNFESSTSCERLCAAPGAREELLECTLLQKLVNPKEIGARDPGREDALRCLCFSRKRRSLRSTARYFAPASHELRRVSRT